MRGEAPFVDGSVGRSFLDAMSSSSSDVLKYSSSAASVSRRPCHRVLPFILVRLGVVSSSCGNRVVSTSPLKPCIWS